MNKLHACRAGSKRASSVPGPCRRRDSQPWAVQTLPSALTPHPGKAAKPSKILRAQSLTSSRALASDKRSRRPSLSSWLPQSVSLTLLRMWCGLHVSAQRPVLPLLVGHLCRTFPGAALGHLTRYMDAHNRHATDQVYLAVFLVP